jgi:hypothetical protein
MIVAVEEHLVSHRERNHLLDLKAQVRFSLTMAIIEDRTSRHYRVGYPNRDRIV